MSNKEIYLPGLNGIRAIAALAVVISHTALALNEFGLNNSIFSTSKNNAPEGLRFAGYGVSIFFTLSGFLITYLLLNEKEMGMFKIKEFYIRRILRIWPLYYLYLVFSIIVAIIYNLHLEKTSIPFYVFLAANIPYVLGKTLPFLAHFWSLGVEEQFYLFFPQIAKLDNSKVFKISIVIIIVWFFLKIIFWLIYKLYGIDFSYFYITRFQIMLFGVISAILYYKKNHLFINITTSTTGQIIAWSMIFFMAINKFHIANIIDEEIVGFMAVFLIMGQITKSNTLINLENKTFDFLGKISFGIYVIHPLIIFFASKILGKLPLEFSSYLIVFLFVILFTIMLAYLSYQYYEKPFLKYKEKFTTIHSRNSRI